MKFKLVNMPMFVPDGGGGNGGGSTGGNTSSGGGDNPDDDDDDDDDEKGNNNDIERLVQARLDKAMEEAKKEKARLEKELKKLRAEKLTADELKQLEDEQKEKELAEREKTIKEKENRFYAVGAIKKAGLDDGSATALKIVDLVMADDEATIEKNINSLKELVNKIVESKVAQRFKAGGREPGGGNEDDKGKGSDKKDKVAELLGKARAEQLNKSSEILKHYL